MLSPLGLPKPNIFAGLRPLRENESMLERSMQRLATGRMINAGRDDPAGLIAGLHLDAAARALDAESRAIQREAAYLATEDGALGAAADMVGELEGLAVQAADSTLTDAEREALQIEGASIVRAVEHTTGAASFGGEKVFDTPLTGEIGVVQAEEGGQSTGYTLADVGRTLNLRENAGVVGEIARRAAADIAVRRAEIGARISNELAPRSRTLDTEMVRLTQARSLIIDTDYAREASALVRASVLTDASRYLVALNARNAGLAFDLLSGAA